MGWPGNVKCGNSGARRVSCRSHELSCRPDDGSPHVQAASAMRSIFSLPVAVGNHKGYFRREGLEFKIGVPIPGGSDKMIDALHDDAADIAHAAAAFARSCRPYQIRRGGHRHK